MAEPVRRRRRVRVADPVTGSTEAQTEAVSDDAPVPSGEPALTTEPDLSHAERGLRGLVGGGSSQVSPAAAMRARDAARPRPEDLARSEAELAIVRRNWTPDSAPPTARRPSP
jgi:hypothetical protein